MGKWHKLEDKRAPQYADVVAYVKPNFFSPRMALVRFEGTEIYSWDDQIELALRQGEAEITHWRYIEEPDNG